MKKEDKATVIAQIAETVKQYPSFYLVETAGLNAEKTSDLRRACFKADIKLLVVKNTLLHKALESLEGDYSEIYPALAGPTTLMCTNVANAPAKLIKDFVKKDDKLPPSSRVHTLKRPFILALTSSTLSALSRARTSSSPTLSRSFSRLPRTLFRPSLRAAASFTAFWKLSRRRKSDSGLIPFQSTFALPSYHPSLRLPTQSKKTTKTHQYNGRSQSFCRTISKPDR